MLTGNRVTLRPITSDDIDELWRRHVDIDSRGEFYPRGILGQTAFRKQFDENGLWSRDEGMLAIVDAEGAIVGHIEYFRTVNYLDEMELSYQVYDRALRGRGYMSEAVSLLVRYLFETRPLSRIRLIIHPDNAASRRVAEKSGFVLEGTMRRAWFNRGRHHDVQLWSILRDEVIGGT
jgi:RimJ/RimL family protein N-acetyltransferase